MPPESRLASWPLPKRDIRLFVAGMAATYARARKKLNQGLQSGEVALLHEARKSITRAARDELSEAFGHAVQCRSVADRDNHYIR